MRVISGSAKGHPLKSVPGKGTRPTTDKVKEAVFSRLGPSFDGLVVLDLFAGTGGLGIEALSRGAEKAIFIDKDPTSIQVIRENLTRCRLMDRSEIYRNVAERAIKALSKREMTFDLVFLDSPYASGFYLPVIDQLMSSNLLSTTARMICEHAAADPLPEQIEGLSLMNQSTYGEIMVSIYTISD